MQSGSGQPQDVRVRWAPATCDQGTLRLHCKAGAATTHIMSDNAENAGTRLWRDRAQLREQERNEAQARARIAEEKVAILMAENDRLSAEVERLRDLLTPDAVRERVETQQQMQALKVELLCPLHRPADSTRH